ncbi:MAG: two-component regulator propeller domain-containing protein [Spirosomataceae bacterium]
MFFLLLSSLGVQSQQVRQVFRKITVDEGLSHTDATDLLQDDKGFIWIATLSGLNRYDGHELKVYQSNQQQFNNVYLNRINKLSRQGQLIFMATQGGLAAFNLSTEKITTFTPTNPATKAIIQSLLNSVLAYKKDLVWVLSDTKVHLLKIDAMEGKISTLPLTLPSTFKATCFTQDHHGTIWIGGNTGVLKVVEHEGQFFTQPIVLLTQQQQLVKDVQSLLFDQNRLIVGGVNQLWISKNLKITQNTIQGNLQLLDGSLLAKNTESPLNITNLLAHQNQLWLGTPAGMLCLENGQFTNHAYLNTLSSNHVSSLMYDASGCLWVSTYGGGVNLLDRHPKPFYTLQFNQFANATGQNPNYIRAIMEDDASGNVWIGTRNAGLIFHDTKQHQSKQFLHQSGVVNSLANNNVRSITKDKTGRIWIGTEGGISILKGNQFQHLIHQPNNPHSLTNNTIYTLGVDVFGQVWAGSWANGLNRITENDGKFEVERIYEGPKGISSSKVTYLYADPLRPEVLVGTTKGLDHLFLNSEGRIARIVRYQGSTPNPKSLSSNFIWPIVRTDEHTLWVGTIGGGLNKVTLLDNGQYEAKSFTTKDGLSSNDIESLLLDNQGNLWMGSKGISMFDPRTQICINYDKNDGLQSNVFKIGGATKGRDGKLYFGGVNGINYFYPDQIKQSNYVPQVVISDVLVNNKVLEASPLSVRHLDKLTLDHLQNNLTIKFSALDYTNSNKCRYRYQLVGFDKEWLETDSKNPQASYSNLDFETYTFQLLATNHDGIWSKTPTLLRIVVNPPWWQSTLAKFVYLLLFLGLLWALYQYQLRWFLLKNRLEIKEVEERKSEEIHQMRLQFFTNISHELRTPLSLILSPVEKLLHDNISEEAKQKYYQLIHRNSSRLLTLVNELMDFRKAEAGVTKLRASETFIAPYLTDICSEFDEAAAENGIDFKVVVPPNDTKAWLDRGIIEKIIVNVVSNAFKYTPKGGSIEVRLAENPTPLFMHSYQIGEKKSQEKYLWLQIKDSGLGIPPDALEHVFERYYRVTESEKDKLLGSGIGLALVKSLILLHHGVIVVSSEVGKGTAFLIGIPQGNTHFKPEELINIPDYQLDDSTIKAIETKQFLEESLEIQASNHQQKNGKALLKKLLIVEDNAELRHFLADSFMGQYQVLEATDGAEGLLIAEEELPDLIISDVMMPNMDGITLCQRIKDNLDTSHTPVILLTAKTSDESKIEGSESGADAYLTKPFSLKLLQLTIHNLMEGRRKLKELYAHDALVEAREIGTTKRDKEFIDQIIKIVERHLDNSELEIEDIAREIGMSRSKLYTKIHSLTGQPVGDFVRKLRMKTAAKIMVSDDVSITEVMERVGIQSQSYFTKAFKREFGKTPTQYLHDFIVEKELKNSI